MSTRNIEHRCYRSITFLGFGWEFMARWVIISWYLYVYGYYHIISGSKKKERKRTFRNADLRTRIHRARSLVRRCRGRERFHIE